MDLTYSMTPHDVLDKEYPEIALKDFDIIYVFEARPFTTMKTKDHTREDKSAPYLLGLESPIEEIGVSNGDGSVHNPSISEKGFYDRLSQQNLELRNRVGELQSVIMHQAKVLRQQHEYIGGLRGRTFRLEEENRYLRQTRQAAPLSRMSTFFPSQAPSNRPPSSFLLSTRTTDPQNRPATSVGQCEYVHEPGSSSLQEQNGQLQFHVDSNIVCDMSANVLPQQFLGLQAAFHHNDLTQTKRSKSPREGETLVEQSQDLVRNSVQDIQHSDTVIEDAEKVVAKRFEKEEQ